MKLLALWCRKFEKTGFYFQAWMDLDPKSWWHNPRFVSDTGGYLVPGDPVQRRILPLEPSRSRLVQLGRGF